MNLAFRSLRYYAASHFGTLLGATVASAVLVGALAVGDSVRESLRGMALARIGRIQYALPAADRFFRSALADDLRPSISNNLATAVLQLPGTAVTPDGLARANQVQILGIDEHFGEFAPESFPQVLQQTDAVILNAPLAAQLRVKVGDTIVLRAQKPSLLSQEAPLSPQQDVSAGFRRTVAAIVGDAQFGRFGLQASQISPLNAFVPLSFLQAQTGLEGKVNLLLTGAPRGGAAPDKMLRDHWQAADAGLEVRPCPGGLEIRTGRIFLDPTVVLAAPPGGRSSLTYFVNELRDGDKTTPYSMVAAVEPSLLPSGTADNDIIIDQWLADDLAAKPSDEIRLTYFILGTRHRLEQKETGFRVRSIVPMEGMAADRTLLPAFPGIAQAEKTENWDAGFPIDFEKIRPKDEAYWKSHRGTPKAFITLAAGQKIWGNRFGDVTAIRYDSSHGTERTIQKKLLAGLEPASIGLVFLPLRERALAASGQAEDFGGLFIGFSFFLIAAALILMAILFQFGLERRTTEIGTLLALGWPPRRVRRLFLREGMAVAVLGAILGTAAGILYAKGILWGLATLWRSAVADSPLQFHVTAGTLVYGAVAGIIVSTIVIRLALRAQTRRPARELLERGSELEWHGSKRRWAGWVAVASGIAAAGALGTARRADVEAFFSGGALLLIAGIASAAVLIRRAAAWPFTLNGLGLRSCARRPNRSLATVALLASGSFLIVAVGANKLDATRDSTRRSSGTGGFSFIGQSALPIVQDLNTKAGRDFFALDEKTLQDVTVIPFRVHDGDDASCLNLNRAQTPRLLGVDPAALQDRGAFTFSKILDPSFAKKPWEMLTTRATNADEIPAIGDEASIQWALHKDIGDTIDYTDGHGRTFKLKLVGALENSVLQGSLIIDAAEFTRRFPDEAGARFFLVDAPAANAATVSEALTRALEDRGMELTPAADRLNAFNAVQNTYLDTFQVLGGLGLLLGSAGLGVVVLRNVLERRGELAVLMAAGFTRGTLRRLILSEHIALECLGLLVGVVAALVAVLPALLSLSAPISYRSLGMTLGLVFVSGLMWAWLAARVALRGELLSALRNE